MVWEDKKALNIRAVPCVLFLQPALEPGGAAATPIELV